MSRACSCSEALDTLRHVNPTKADEEAVQKFMDNIHAMAERITGEEDGFAAEFDRDFNQLDDQRTIELVNGPSVYKRMVRHMFVKKALQSTSRSMRSGIKKVALVPRNKKWSMEDKVGESMS